METFGNKFCQKSAPRFYCKFCDYGTCKKTNYDTHIKSNRHNMVTDDYIKGQNSAYIQPKISHQHEDGLYICSCGSQYKHRQGLWRHKQKCNQKPEEPKQETNKNDVNFDKDLILMLINQNKELLEIVKNGTHNTTTTTTHTNSHNKAFNLNFFLNETCKNAMNITDFVDSIKLQLSDLMEVGEIGFVEDFINSL